jgi:hypothetical protein
VCQTAYRGMQLITIHEKENSPIDFHIHWQQIVNNCSKISANWLRPRSETSATPGAPQKTSPPPVSRTH